MDSCRREGERRRRSHGFGSISTRGVKLQLDDGCAVGSDWPDWDARCRRQTQLPAGQRTAPCLLARLGAVLPCPALPCLPACPVSLPCVGSFLRLVPTLCWNENEVDLQPSNITRSAYTNHATMFTSRALRMSAASMLRAQAVASPVKTRSVQVFNQTRGLRLQATPKLKAPVPVSGRRMLPAWHRRSTC